MTDISIQDGVSTLEVEVFTKPYDIQPGQIIYFDDDEIFIFADYGDDSEEYF